VTRWPKVEAVGNPNGDWLVVVEKGGAVIVDLSRGPGSIDLDSATQERNAKRIAAAWNVTRDLMHRPNFLLPFEATAAIKDAEDAG
jgi:hypothetical protein